MDCGRFDQYFLESFTFCLISLINLSSSGSLLSLCLFPEYLPGVLWGPPRRLLLLRWLPPWLLFMLSVLGNCIGSYLISWLFLLPLFSFPVGSAALLVLSSSMNKSALEFLIIWADRRDLTPKTGRPQPENTWFEISAPVSWKFRLKMIRFLEILFWS